MNFRNYITESKILYSFNEVFDTPAKITKTYSIGTSQMSEFFISGNLYRVNLEFQKMDNCIGCNIIFELWDNITTKWVVSSVTKQLDKNEVLSVFSTVIEQSKKANILKCDFVFCTTDNTQKSRIYVKMLKKLLPTYSIGIDDRSAVHYISAIKNNNNETLYNKFKRKFQ